MNDELNGSAPMTHWLVGGAALIWNLFGFMVYLMTVRATPEQMAQQYSAAEIAFMDAVPVWATSANAIAVTTGVLACVLLLLRNSLALAPFVRFRVSRSDPPGDCGDPCSSLPTPPREKGSFRSFLGHRFHDVLGLWVKVHRVFTGGP